MFRVSVRRGTLGVKLNDFHISQLIRSLYHRPDQCLGGRRHAMDPNSVTTLYRSDCVFGGNG